MMSEEKPEAVTDLGVLSAPKRKQGRPRKNHALLPVGEKSVVLQKSDGRGRKPRRKKCDVTWPAVVDSAFIGQQVHGVLDGSFDAGYLLTVRVGDSQTVLRGVVFEPSLSVPISRANDIAPNVRLAKRNEHILPQVHQPAPITSPGVASPVPRVPVTTPVVVTALSATQSTPFRDYQTPTSQGAQTGSAQVVSVTAELQGGSSKAAPVSQECSDTASPHHPAGEAGPQQKMDVQSEAQLQTV